MPDKRVFNASPLIVLGKVNLLSLLSEVLSWAYEHPGYEAVIDDRAARDCAYSMNIRVRGTIGIVLLAKRKNKIDRIAPVLLQLREAGLRVSQALFDEALRLAGEDISAS
jgi:predicted nucleic acid-binding protein